MLELGCGSASMLADVPDPPWPVVVADLAPDALRLARGAAAGALCLDATRPLPLRDEALAAVLMGELIEHVYDPVALLRECRRVLVPSGLLVLTTPNLATLQDRVIFTGQPGRTAASSSLLQDPAVHRLAAVRGAAGRAVRADPGPVQLCRVAPARRSMGKVSYPGPFPAGAGRVAGTGRAAAVRSPPIHSR
ncbi:methyltransferase domain-containing protein [Plantactinospora sp. CA-290183]|uniref:methyltransferase domain-containing protein n=1 Tax=Plantactinospora sp. CA-290183 TaxID=3240006 RepID=UPI003D90FDEA